MKKLLTASLVFLFLIFGLIAENRAADTFSVVATLGALPNGNTPNPVVEGSDGNLYGTTTKGGTGNLGTVFQLTTSGTLTTLYSSPAARMAPRRSARSPWATTGVCTAPHRLAE